MTDPVVNPLTAEDRIFDDLGPAATVPAPDATEARIGVIERQRERERNDLLTVLNSSAGQALVFRVLAFCNVYSTTLNHPANEGRRQVGLWLIDVITKADPELYPQLLIAHLKRQRELAATEAAIDADARRKAPPATVFTRLARAVGLRSHAENA